MRRDKGEPVRDILELDIKGNRGRGRPKKRWIDCVKEDLNEKELTVDMVKDRMGWRSRIRAADPGTVWDQGWVKEEDTEVSFTLRPRWVRQNYVTDINS